jgi:hypothetical protein
MRHLSRTHRVSIAWLHEQHRRNRFDFKYVRSEEMAADIFTKSMPAPHKWKHARRLINVFESSDEFMDFFSPSPVGDSTPTLCVARCMSPFGSSSFSRFDTLHCSRSSSFAPTPLSHPNLAMSESRIPGGAVTANAEEVLVLARTAFREDCDLLVSILQARDTISANSYLNEDLQCIAKRYEAAEKELGLTMLRNPSTVAQRLCDPLWFRRMVVQSPRGFTFLAQRRRLFELHVSPCRTTPL